MLYVTSLDGTVLVTGGAGYIGSHTVRSLREAGRDIVVLDSLELGRREAVIDAPLVVGNIADNDLVTATCNEYGVTQLVHFAAYKAVGESMESPAKYWRNNVTGTVELVGACLASGVSDVVFSSSCSVNGTPATVPVTEDAPIHPESVYAESKAMVEKILSWYGVTSGLNSVSLRYFNAAGASFDGRIGEDWTYSFNLIPLAMKAVSSTTTSSRCSATTTTRPTAPASATTSTSKTSPMLTSRRSPTSATAANHRSERRHRHRFIGVRRDQRTAALLQRPVAHEVVARRAGDPVSTYANPDHALEDARVVAQARSRRHRSDCLRVAPQPTRRQPLNDDRPQAVRLSDDLGRWVHRRRPHPVKPAQQHRHSTRVVTQPMTGPDEQTQFSIAMRVHELTSI